MTEVGDEVRDEALVLRADDSGSVNALTSLGALQVVSPQLAGALEEATPGGDADPSLSIEQGIEELRANDALDGWYDSLLDDVEEALHDQAVKAFLGSRWGDARDALGVAQELRTKWYRLLDQADIDEEEEQRLREFATHRSAVTMMLSGLTEAIFAFLSGRRDDALATLAKMQGGMPTELHEGTYAQLGLMTEQLGAFIRLSVRDFPGARAGFLRAGYLARRHLEDAKRREQTGDTGSGDGADGATVADAAKYLRINVVNFEYAVASSAAWAEVASYRQSMVYADFTASQRNAEAAAEHFTTSSHLAADFEGLLGGPALASTTDLAMASSHEGLSRFAAVENLLSAEQWEACEAEIRRAQESLERGAMDVLARQSAMSKPLQEGLLNEALQTGTQYRRRLEVQRALVMQLHQATADLRSLQSSLASTLGGGGVTVNTNTEIVTSVQQQVELNQQIEQNLRNRLRDFSRDLDSLPLDETTADLQQKAKELAAAPETGRSFFERLRGFSLGLKDLIVAGGEAAGPVKQLLTALSIIG